MSLCCYRFLCFKHLAAYRALNTCGKPCFGAGRFYCGDFDFGMSLCGNRLCFSAKLRATYFAVYNNIVRSVFGASGSLFVFYYRSPFCMRFVPVIRADSAHGRAANVIMRALATFISAIATLEMLVYGVYPITVAMTCGSHRILFGKDFTALRALNTCGKPRFGASRSFCGDFFLGMSFCRYRFLCFKHLTARGTLYTCGKTRFGAGRFYCGNFFFSMTLCGNFFAYRVTARADLGFFAIGGAGRILYRFPLTVFVSFRIAYDELVSFKLESARRAIDYTVVPSTLRAGGGGVIFLLCR